jgi:tRNA(fMet)-specific endonuclease VapC
VIKYSLDTNILIDLFNRPFNSPVSERLRSFGLEAFAVSSVVIQELVFGALNGSPHKLGENLQRVNQLRFAILPFDGEDAHDTGRIRHALKLVGTPIDHFDLMIGGQARARGLILVTRNTRHFSRIPGLKVENWIDA